MNQDTKSHLESQLRALMTGAHRQREEAQAYEDQARHLRECAARDQTVAFEIRAMLDGEKQQAEAEPANSQGAGGHHVQHSGPEEASEVVMPATAWIPTGELTAQQQVLASDRRFLAGPDAVSESLIQLDFLDAAQRAKYNV